MHAPTQSAMIGGGGGGDAFRYRRRVSQLRRLKLWRKLSGELCLPEACAHFGNGQTKNPNHLKKVFVHSLKVYFSIYSNSITTEGLMTWSSEVFRIFLSRDVKDKCCKSLNVSNIFCGLPPPTSFCTLITPIAVSGGWAGYSWVYDSVGTDSHNDYWLYVLDDPNTSVYLELRVLTVDSFFIWVRKHIF